MESSSNPRRGGGDRAITRHQDHFLLIQSRRQRFQNTTTLNNEFKNGTGLRISTQTVRNSLHEFGLNNRILPELTSDGLLVTGRQCYLLTSPDSVSILLTVSVENAQREI